MIFGSVYSMSRYSVFHSFQDYQNIVEHSPTGMPVELCLRIRTSMVRHPVPVVKFFYYLHRESQTNGRAGSLRSQILVRQRDAADDMALAQVAHFGQALWLLSCRAFLCYPGTVSIHLQRFRLPFRHRSTETPRVLRDSISAVCPASIRRNN
jgi:hypothetical protein